ncbi:FAD-binding oxidoreductase [Streptomyces sp. TLI_171]|uniref:FAD-binding oxidoreductase n=1 Tax=Streptomyces sp. TLI_171 TaxID=1938859 RepID=UPI000C19B8A5|nr:FAD-binding oxidoreductase [Streptomyces sp. TLI_171]RKE18091.1 FAD/FMN-containing dehydrogenase [Streptomyces sp. TLI_171]
MAKAAMALAEGFRGEILVPGDDGYDGARAVWNAAVDRRPEVIARCTGVADVLQAVVVAREHGLAAAVRGAGHSQAGLGTTDGGMLIDLSGMRGVRVDPARRIARAQPGVTWGLFDHETQAFDLATPGAPYSAAGIAGVTLGGGVGWLARAYGLTCDNLVEADVVTAEGRLLTASSASHPELFRGLRGGGGNFGVVTSFTYRLHRVGPHVLCGAVYVPAELLAPTVAAVRDFMAQAPDGVTVGIEFGRPRGVAHLPDRPMLRIGLCWSGRADRGREAVAPLRALPGVVADTVQTRPYTLWQQMLDPGRGAGAGNFGRSEFLSVLDDAAIHCLGEQVATMPSPEAQLQLAFLGGAVARVGPEDTAYTYRTAPYLLSATGRWTDGPPEPQVAWVRRCWQAMRQFSSGGAYVNLMGQEGQARVVEAYGLAKYERLVALKDRYDPTNLFRVNQNIRPSG